ncbi:MipA/OmpV family protein [Falsiroseomonas sp. E2-1-a20]|uniref:MipA/OmpV family protein n=1 Tax=Falsiroseomonas sp. E2-1-a20 TaxID=3239300 RepID=UPI003F37A186
MRVNVSPWPSAEFGPVVALRRGRSDADNARVKRLDEVDDAVEAGAFLRLPFRGVLTARDEAAIELQVLQDASSAHDGTLFTFGGSYRFSPVARLGVGLVAVATYASDDYTETNFGIDARNAAASGLPAFSAGGGIKDVALSLTANYELTPNWGLVGVLGYRRLLGDAADSPIVRREGNENQFSFGLGISYGF